MLLNGCPIHDLLSFWAGWYVIRLLIQCLGKSLGVWQLANKLV